MPMFHLWFLGFPDVCSGCFAMYIYYKLSLTGPLEAVTNLTAAYEMNHMIHLSWNAPYTLARGTYIVSCAESSLAVVTLKRLRLMRMPPNFAILVLVTTSL